MKAKRQMSLGYMATASAPSQLAAVDSTNEYVLLFNNQEVKERVMAADSLRAKSGLLAAQ